MPRKAFIADVAEASEKATLNIIDVMRGDDDGEISCIYLPASAAPINIGLLALDVSGYPTESSWMIYTKSPEIPPGVNEVLDDVQKFSAGMKALELLQTVSQRLTKVLASGTANDPVTLDDDDSDVQMLDGADEDEDEDEDSGGSEEDYGGGFDDSDDDGSFGDMVVGRRPLSTQKLSPDVEATLNRRIKEDLRAVNLGGYHIGILSGMKADSQTSVLSISIRAAKLGLSEEALQAWDLEPNQYIVLLIRYSAGYKTLDDVISTPAKNLDIAYRIGVSNRYKPTLLEALAAFTEMTKEGRHSDSEEGSGEGKSNTAGFNSIFISSSLNEFINDQFVSLLKIRHGAAIGWDGAKLFLNDKQGRLDLKSQSLPEHYYKESSPKQASLPAMMSADHLTEIRKELSFPLIATQFAMRYLLRCTEFCLVCHDKIQGDFEALKPYVCDKPLCLYQYMSLGFGPSVEHEILTQPYVVDLLVSFCYSAASCRRIREYPTGMSLSVPPVTKFVTQVVNGRLSYNYVPVESTSTEPILDSATEVKYDLAHQELIFSGLMPCPIRNGDWIVVTYPGTTASQTGVHCRVADISLYPTVKLSDAANPNPRAGAFQGYTTNHAAAPATPATTPPPPSLAPVPAKMMIYDKNFDDMDEVSQAETIVTLLETLPSITELRQYLVQQARTSEPSLRQWKERLSPAALGLLRWIIASNRSCIVQVDRCPGQEGPEADVSKIRFDQKCDNVDKNWLQFRFAQGSPDKEQRFLNALKAEQSKLDSKYPTMFAFHGSPIQNWHSIIRHGLDFKETLHGRAYGHGVYHAMDQSTSIGYAQAGAVAWPGSELKVSSAMSLNEIVNCPSQFTSSHPFMVVQHVDWIQARYLFVQTNGRSTAYDGDVANNSPDISASDLVEQDPKFTPKSISHKPIGIPRCAITISRAFRADSTTPKVKRRKTDESREKLSMQDTILSDEDEIEDITFLISDVDVVASGDNGKARANESAKEKTGGSFLKSLNIFGKSKSKASEKPQTDFVPGSLDQASLPLMNEPSYATPSATMRISRELKELLKIQEKTPVHELGWYLNPELVNNVYQWIVELHSFPTELPLAKDMKAAGMTSIVLEIRFPKDYPYSPPFIRVIRPRFLPFTQGGGGHVTGGGAMCMELLTNSGWSSVSSLEGVLLQVRMAIQNLEPKPARLESQVKAHQRDYGTAEAMEAYIRACRTHGWAVPKDFQDFASGGDASGSGGYY